MHGVDFQNKNLPHNEVTEYVPKPAPLTAAQYYADELLRELVNMVGEYESLRRLEGMHRSHRTDNAWNVIRKARGF